MAQGRTEGPRIINARRSVPKKPTGGPCAGQGNRRGSLSPPRLLPWCSQLIVWCQPSADAHPARRPRPCGHRAGDGLGLGGAPPVLDLDHLATAVLTAVRADMMRALEFTAVAARNEIERRDEVMPTAIALMRPANSLFWKCTHDAGLLVRPCRVLSHRHVVAAHTSCSGRYQSCPLVSGDDSSSINRSASWANRSSGAPSGSVDRSRGPGQSGPQLGCIGMERRIHCRNASPRSI